VTKKTARLLAEREQTHGDFFAVARLAQGFKGLARQGRNWQSLAAYRREALEQHFTKLARLLEGDPEHADHIDDMSGYLALFARKKKRGGK
jgi:hypothetical protein